MNQKIEESLRESILSARAYLANKTMRESAEEWKAFWLEQTRLLGEKNEPSREADITHNLSVIDNIYSGFISALENEDDYTKTIHTILKKFDNFDEAKNIDYFVSQLKTALPKLTLRNDADSLYGLFFEYDSSPVFSVTCFPKQPFEIIIGEPKYIKYEKPYYASDVIIEIDFAPIGHSIFSEEFEEMNEAFESELGYIHKIQLLHIHYSYLCLHQALKHPEINEIMNQTPIDANALFYAMQHDCEHLTIFIRA